jgi:hypothetical protein
MSGPSFTCTECGKLFYQLEHDRWCEDCFDKGLSKDMNSHWDNFWEEELGGGEQNEHSNENKSGIQSRKRGDNS